MVETTLQRLNNTSPNKTTLQILITVQVSSIELSLYSCRFLYHLILFINRIYMYNIVQIHNGLFTGYMPSKTQTEEVSIMLLPLIEWHLICQSCLYSPHHIVFQFDYLSVYQNQIMVMFFWPTFDWPWLPVKFTIPYS